MKSQTSHEQLRGLDASELITATGGIDKKTQKWLDLMEDGHGSTPRADRRRGAARRGQEDLEVGRYFSIVSFAPVAVQVSSECCVPTVNVVVPVALPFAKCSAAGIGREVTRRLHGPVTSTVAM
jgi:hypothetical protein